MIRKLLLIFLGLILVLPAFPQNYTMLYQFSEINQNLMINPAASHPYKTVLGIPIIGHASVDYQNTMFAPKDYFNDNSLNYRVENILNNMRSSENILINQNLDLLFVAFAIKKTYISFGARQVSSVNLALPRDLLKLAYYGNSETYGDFSLSRKDMNIEIFAGQIYHLGFQQSFLNDSLIIGARVKRIFGLAHAQVSRLDIDLQLDMFKWQVETDILVETSGSNIEETIKVYGLQNLILPKNRGWGFDFGATYKLKNLTLSASLLNVGSISWKNDTKIYTSKGSYDFKGLTFDEDTQNLDYESILDTLAAAFNVKDTSDISYKSKLPTHFLSGIGLTLNPKHRIGLTYQGSVWGDKLNHNFGASYIFSPGKRFQLIFAYSLLSGRMSNFSFGASGALGPLQIMLLTDNIYGLVMPTTLKSSSLRFGINLILFKNQTTSNLPKDENTYAVPFDNKPAVP
jgi:hypothetical protein